MNILIQYLKAAGIGNPLKQNISRKNMRKMWEEEQRKKEVKYRGRHHGHHGHHEMEDDYDDHHDPDDWTY